jgi:hypothetical protein
MNASKSDWVRLGKDLRGDGFLGQKGYCDESMHSVMMHDVLIIPEDPNVRAPPPPGFFLQRHDCVTFSWTVQQHPSKLLS